MAVMVEAINDLISLLEGDEEYARCAIFRDVLIELDNYEREVYGDGDKAPRGIEAMHSRADG